MKKEGDGVTINGVGYVLGPRIGGGLEGSVFDIASGPNTDHYVIKIINESKLSVDEKITIYNHLKELAFLRSTNEELRHIMAMPIALLDSDLGYVMKKAEGFESLSNYINYPKDNSFKEWFGKEYTLKKRYQTIIKMFDALRTIHINGLVFTDLSPRNVMTVKDKKKEGIVFIDTDNLRSASHYTAVLGTPRYIAPELYRSDDDIPSEIGGKTIDKNNLSKSRRATIDSDVFSAAIIAFEMLMLQHPFVGDDIDDGTPEDEEKAFRIETDYIFKKGTNNPSTHGLTTRVKEIISPEIMKLFERTFVEGIKNPHLRPTDEEFISTFQKGLDLIIKCPNCEFDHIYVPDEDNYCINCDAKFNKQWSLTTFIEFEGLTNEEALNSIETDESCNLVGPINHENRYNMSVVMLERGVDKILYLRHFEEKNNRSSKFAIVTLDEGDNVRIKINEKIFKNAAIYKGKEKREYLEKGSNYIKLYHKVVLQEEKHGPGTRRVCLEFKEC